MLTMRWLFLSLALIVCAAQSETSVRETGKQQNDQPTKGGAEKSDKNKTTSKPLPTASVQPVTKPENGTADAQGTEQHQWYDTFLNHPTDWLLALFNGLLVLFTWRLAVATSGLWIAAGTQAEDTRKSIAEATRAATAMENVAAATKRNTELLEPMLRKQMRAYIAIDTGGGTYQDANNKFAGSPVMNNTGLTPARNVSYSVNAAILTIENIAPNDLVIPAIGPMVINDAGIAPRQQFTIQGVVNETFPANEVQEIMLGKKRRLFVWGIVTYDDVFGGHWWTKFCHNHIFYLGVDNTIKVNSYYHSTHNDAT